MTTRLCDFCQKETVYCPITISKKQRKLTTYFCYDCKAEYVCWSGANVTARHLYTVIDEKCYRWSVTMISNVGHIWLILEPGIPGKQANKKLELVRVFKEDVPIITPDNIKDKLSTYLLFL